MINASLQFLASQLNQYLRLKNPIQEDMAVVSRLMDNDGRESERATLGSSYSYYRPYIVEILLNFF